MYNIRNSLIGARSGCLPPAVILLVCISFSLINDNLVTKQYELAQKSRFIATANAHIVLTRDYRGQNLVLSGEGGGKGGKKGGGGGNVVLARNDGDGGEGGGESSNLVLEDAMNKEGDVVISGKNIVIPGEDGHIVLADSRTNGAAHNNQRGPPINPMLYWLPYLSGRARGGNGYMMSLFGGFLGPQVFG